MYVIICDFFVVIGRLGGTNEGIERLPENFQYTSVEVTLKIPMPRTSFQCKGWLCLVDFFNYNCGIAKPSDLRSWFLPTTMCLRGGKTLWCSGNRTWVIDEQAPPANALSVSSRTNKT